MSKTWFRALCALCAAALLISLIWLLAPRAVLPPEPSPVYTLRDEGGRVAVYTGEEAAPSAPLAVYDIYTRLLPENDLLHLQAGIPVYSEAELQTLLEDFGL